MSPTHPPRPAGAAGTADRAGAADRADTAGAVGRMRVAADHDTCVGAGMCVTTAPDVFDQGDDGLVAPLVEQVPSAHQAAARSAVALCPAGALRLFEG